MNCTVQKLSEEMIPELTRCLQEFFPQITEEYIRRAAFENPLLAVHSESAVFPGAVLVAENARILGFTASFASEIFLGTEKLNAAFWGMTYVNTAGRAFTADLIMHLQGDPQIDLNFCNTANAAAAKMNRAMRFHTGPESCHGIRFEVFDIAAFGARFASKLCGGGRGARLLQFALTPAQWIFAFRHRKLTLPAQCRLLSEIDDELFAKFQTKLVEKNTGLLSSRAPEVLHWVYDRLLEAGEVALYGFCRKDGSLGGYLALRRTETYCGSNRYELLDWVAIDNDEEALDALLTAAKYHVARNAGYILELAGYPMFAAGLVRKHLPFFRKTQSNYACWLAGERALDKKILKEVDRSWFFGPFDGDRKIVPARDMASERQQ